jgi:hypothetical protein
MRGITCGRHIYERHTYKRHTYKRHTYGRHTYGSHTYERHTCRRHTYESHTYESHTYERHVHEGHTYERHAHEMHAMIIEPFDRLWWDNTYMVLELCSESAAAKCGDVTLFLKYNYSTPPYRRLISPGALFFAASTRLRVSF